MGEIVNIGDIDLHYEVHGKGDPIVFIHGMGADRQAWMFQLQDLQNDFQVVIFDNRDAGKSSRSEKSYDIAQLAQDTIALLESLEIERCHLVGASMGGAIAQQIAISAPERLATLSLLSTYPSVDSRMRAAVEIWAKLYRMLPRSEMTRSWFPMLYGRRFWDENPETIEELIQFTIDNPDAPDADSFARQCNAVLSHDTSGRLSEIKTPTLVLCGESDPLTPPAFSEEIANLIPNARLDTYADASHAFFIERAADVNSMLADFFTEHRSLIQ